MDNKLYKGKYENTSTEFNDKSELQSLIQNIMVTDGPDGHCDGADTMAEIIWKRVEELKKGE